jgi:hypothetical protein
VAQIIIIASDKLSLPTSGVVDPAKVIRLIVRTIDNGLVIFCCVVFTGKWLQVLLLFTNCSNTEELRLHI